MDFLILFQAMLARVTTLQLGVFATWLAVHSGFRAVAKATAPVIDAKKETNRFMVAKVKTLKKSPGFPEVLGGEFLGTERQAANI